MQDVAQILFQAGGQDGACKTLAASVNMTARWHGVQRA